MTEAFYSVIRPICFKEEGIQVAYGSSLLLSKELSFKITIAQQNFKKRKIIHKQYTEIKNTKTIVLFKLLILQALI